MSKMTAEILALIAGTAITVLIMLLAWFIVTYPTVVVSIVGFLAFAISVYGISSIVYWTLIDR